MVSDVSQLQEAGVCVVPMKWQVCQLLLCLPRLCPFIFPVDAICSNSPDGVSRTVGLSQHDDVVKGSFSFVCDSVCA